MASVVCFQWVRAISIHFRVSIRNSWVRGASGGGVIRRGGRTHLQFPAAG